MICGTNPCGCGIVSSSLVVTGTGGQGDPYHIETNAFGTVTSSTRPSSPFVGQWIWETDTGLQRVWDGTAWRIVGGTKPPACHIRMSTTSPVSHATWTNLPFDIEDYDPFNWHSTSVNTDRVTPNIPGWYEISFALRIEDQFDYNRYLAEPWLNGSATLRRVDVGLSGSTYLTNPAVADAAGWLNLNGTTDYVTLAAWQANAVSAIRGIMANSMKVEWKAPP